MQRNILIIDDHDDLATALDEVFSHTGHKVTVVKSRTAALAIDHIEKFDLVITDLDVDPHNPRPDGNGNAPICLPEIPEEVTGEQCGDGTAQFELGGFYRETAAFLDAVSQRREPSPGLRESRQSVAIALSMRERRSEYRA